VIVERDSELATRLATEAGEQLVRLRAELFARRTPPWEVMDAGDATGQRFIADELARARPDDAVLSEEGLEDPRRFRRDRVWIVDPLDGTREFGEAGRVDWAVHVALWDQGRFAAAAVALPALERVLSTDPPPPVPPVERERPVVVSSRSRRTFVTEVVAGALGADVMLLGSAGAKAMAVVVGAADIYVHAGGMYQWDSAAPAGVALAAGFHVSRIDGTPLVYNEPDVWLPDLLVCRPELAAQVLHALDGAAGW
jgi:3'(2'), 5'-bisphosphate nucleotidase